MIASVITDYDYMAYCDRSFNLIAPSIAFSSLVVHSVPASSIFTSFALDYGQSDVFYSLDRANVRFEKDFSAEVRRRFLINYSTYASTQILFTCREFEYFEYFRCVKTEIHHGYKIKVKIR